MTLRRFSSILLAIAATLMAVPVAQADIPELQGAWHLDSNDASSPDSSGHGLSAAKVGTPVAVSPAKFSNGLRFPAEGDYLNAGNHPELQPAGQISVMAWVRSPTTPTFVKGILAQGAQGSCSFSSYALYTGGSNPADQGTRFYVHTAGGTVRTTAVNNATLWNGQWHHLAGTYDGTTSRIYVDGQLAGSGTGQAGPIAYGLGLNNDFTIGGLVDPACSENTNFTGDMDEVRVYSRALTGDEVFYLGRPDNTSPPELPTAGPVPPAPVLEKNLTPPKVQIAGATPGVKDSVRYKCTDGTWSGLAGDNVFKYQWYNDDGIKLSDGQPAGPIKSEAGQFLDVSPRRSGKKYFCTVTATMISRQRLNASSTIVLVSSLLKASVIAIQEEAVGNFGIRGIDVFQVAQPNKGAQQFSYVNVPRAGGFTRFCGAGVPSNLNDGDCTTYVGPAQEATYDGDHLDSLKPTSAVVYVDRDAVVSAGQDVEVILQGGPQGRGLYAGELRQTIKPPVGPSPVVSFAQREDETYGVRFDLPQDWVSGSSYSTLGSMHLHASVRLPTSAYPKIECELGAGCEADDSFDLSGVPVKHNFYPVSVRTVQVLKPDQLPGQPNVLTPAIASPDNVLASVTELFPGGGRFEISPYATTLTADTDSFTATSKNCPAPKNPDGTAKAESAQDVSDRVRDCRSGAVFAALEAYRKGAATNSGYDMLVGVHRYTYPRADGTPSEEPGTSESKLTPSTAPGTQSIAHLNDGSKKRPLTAAGHEFGHQLGLVHADFLQKATSTNSCGGNDGGQVGEAWPPDNRGRLQGVKFDPADGKRYVDTATTPWYDLMSYCANGDTDAWLSPRNYNHLEYELALLDSAKPKTFVKLSAGASQAGAGLITGTLINGQATITSVVPASGGVIAPAPDPASELRIQAYDAAGRALPDVGAKVELMTNHDGAATFSAPLPRGAARVEIKSNGAVLDQRTATRKPSVRVISPRSGARARRNLTVRWKASDPDGGPLTATVQFSPRGSAFRTVFLGPSKGSVTIPAGMLQAARHARVRVFVNDGFNVAGAISGAFRSDGVPPRVRIQLPASRSGLNAGARVLLAGQGIADSGRFLAGRSLTWYAGRRRLGRGSPLTVKLPAGRVRLSLRARDSQGRVSVARRTVTVAPIPLEFKSLRAPARVKHGARSLTLRIATTTAATLRVGGRSVKVNGRAKNVVVRLAKRPSTGVLRVALRITARGPRQRAITRTLIIYRL